MMARKSRKTRTGSLPPARTGKQFNLEHKARWLVPVLLALIVLIGLGLRASDLRADPPPYLSWSFAPYSDEAHNAYTARNLALYGALKVDDYVPFVVYPLVNVLLALVFKLFGVGFVQLKLVSLLAGVLAILVMYLLVKEESGPVAGLLAAFGIAVCYPLVMYSRLGLVESVQILFLLATGLFFVRGLKRPRQMAISGLFAAGAALFVKVSGVFVLPAVALVFLWQFIEARLHKESCRQLGRAVGWWCFGAGVVFVLWLLVVFFPHRADYIKYVVRHSFESPTGHPRNIVGYLLNTFSVGGPYQVGATSLKVFFDTLKNRIGFWLFPKALFVVLLGFVFLPGFARKRLAGMRYLFAWFVIGALMLGYMNYHPPRYEIMLLIPLIGAFALMLTRLLESGTLVPQVKRSFLKSGFYCLWLWPVVLHLATYTSGFWGLVRPTSGESLLALTFGISLGLAGLGHFVLRLLKRGIDLRSIPARAVLVIVVLVLVLRLDLVQYFGWFNNRRYDIVSCSRKLDADLPDDAVLAGSWAPALLVESRKRALFVSEQWSVNVFDPVGRYGVTHLISLGDGDVKLFERMYPGLMQRATEFLNCRFPEPPLVVYTLPQPTQNKE